jgi:hypothetical protein
VEQEPVFGARVVDQPRTEGVRQLERVALDALRVGTGARVLRFERARKRRDRLLVGVLEEDALAALDLEQVPEVARVEKELLLVFDRALAAVGRRHRRKPAREPLHDVQELERAEGLAHERVGAVADARVPDGAGEQDDCDTGCVLIALYSPADLAPAHSRKPDVEHDDIRPVADDGLQGGFAGADVVHLDVDDLEGRPQESPKRGVVVDDEQAHWRLP